MGNKVSDERGNGDIRDKSISSQRNNNLNQKQKGKRTGNIKKWQRINCDKKKLSSD